MWCFAEKRNRVHAENVEVKQTATVFSFTTVGNQNIISYFQDACITETRNAGMIFTVFRKEAVKKQVLLYFTCNCSTRIFD